MKIDGKLMEYRKVKVVTTKELDKEFLYPENIVIRISDRVRKAPLDFGALAFAIRDNKLSTRRNNKMLKVCMKSIVPHRRELLRNLFDLIYTSCWSDETIKRKYKSISTIINWLDKNNHVNAFESAINVERAYRDYTNWLHKEIQSNGRIKPRTARGKQCTFKGLIEICFESEVHYIVSSIPTIKYKNDHFKPPDGDDVALYVDTLCNMATTFSDFLLSEEKFPFKFKTREYETWVFAGWNRYIKTPHTNNDFHCYDYDQGRIKKIDEYMQEASKKTLRKSSRESIRRQIALHEKANNNLRCDSRMRIASYAMNSYTWLFQGINGATLSEIANMEYSNDLYLNQNLIKRELVVIKARAKGRKSRYLVGGKKGVQLFKKYLELREWVLNGYNYKYLFFCLEKRGSYTGKFKQLSQNSNYNFLKCIKGTYIPKLENISTSSMRKHKSTVLHQLGVTPSITAGLLNHSLRTNTESYLEISDKEQKKELSLFWNSVESAAKHYIKTTENLVNETEQSIAVGHCEDINNPSTLGGNAAPIEVRCTTQYGCLYCAHYICHADDEDVHKLLSLKYVLNEVECYAEDWRHAMQLFSHLKIRVDEILNSISDISDVYGLLVDSQKKRVFELGELTPFWENKLAHYENLGIVI